MNLIIGRKPVLEAINSGETIEQIFLLYGQHGGIIEAIRVAAKKKGIKLSELSAEKFNNLSSGSNNQGVIAKIRHLRYYTLEEIINSRAKSDYPLLVLLDSIQDPHNVGAIIRTAECSGADGIILTQHNSASVNETVIKTSAGAVEHMKICSVSNLANTIKTLKEKGYWIIGTSLENSVSYTDPDYKMPVALILGNEEKGIRRLTADTCDILVKIPMLGKIQSLNVSVSAGIILFELLRKRSL